MHFYHILVKNQPIVNSMFSFPTRKAKYFPRNCRHVDQLFVFSFIRNCNKFAPWPMKILGTEPRRFTALQPGVSFLVGLIKRNTVLNKGNNIWMHATATKFHFSLANLVILTLQIVTSCNPAKFMSGQCEGTARFLVFIGGKLILFWIDIHTK